MAIIPLSSENFVQSSIRLHPSRSYISTSGSFSVASVAANGAIVTGSVHVFAERSPSIFTIDPRYEVGSITFSAGTYNEHYNTIIETSDSAFWEDEGVAHSALVHYMGGLPANEFVTTFTGDPNEWTQDNVAHDGDYSLGLSSSLHTPVGVDGGQLFGSFWSLRQSTYFGLDQARSDSKQEITRITAPFDLTTGSMMKNVIRKQLSHAYRNTYPSAHWSFVNYSTLNFFTGSNGIGGARVDTDGDGSADRQILIPDAALPTGSALAYANQLSIEGTGNKVWRYTPSGSFTAEFYINPRYTNDVAGGEFKAGTIMHLSSTLAISLVSGSSTDASGLVDGYRIMVQLTSSADIPPSLLTTSPSNEYGARKIGDVVNGDAGLAWGNGVLTASNLTFVSSDNALKRNHWHHVAVRWGTQDMQAGTGSIVVDGKVDSYFVVPSASIGTPVHAGTGSDALIIGNFWEGNPSGSATAQGPGPSPQQAMPQRALFTYAVGAGHPEFTYNVGTVGHHDKYGCTPFHEQEYTGLVEGLQLRHPLNAEIHEIKLWKSFRSLSQIYTSSIESTPPGENPDLVFYVPPFFTTDGNHPMQEYLRYTHRSNYDYTLTPKPEFPINQELAFRLGGNLVNLESYVYDFAGGVSPRLLHLSQSIVKAVAQGIASASFWTADQVLYTEPTLIKRNLSILPNDNGIFHPRFSDMLSTGSSDEEYPTAITNPEWRYTNDFGQRDFSMVSLLNAATSSYLLPTDDASAQRDKFGDYAPRYTTKVEPDGETYADEDSVETFLNAFYGTTRDYDASWGSSVFTTLAERLGDLSYNPIFFNISNLFYGKRIQPGTFSIFDNEMTGACGKVKIKLRDDGRAGLYRADCETAQAKWNSVGTIFYEEGIAVIKSPNLPRFGEQQFNVNFRGEQDIHMLETNVLVQQGMLNSSSNPQYYPMTASDYVSEYDEDFVYITGINLHDNNLNVIAKTAFAQPIVKRPSEKFLFRIKIDF